MKLNRNLWSDDEVRFLISSREKRMPWKNISARLGRSEGACQVKYYSLNHGASIAEKKFCESVDKKYTITIDITGLADLFKDLISKLTIRQYD